MESQVRGGTRWKRFAVVMVPSVAATACIGVALAQGALAASFSVSGQSFKVTADQLNGTGFAQYGALDSGYNLDGSKSLHPVAVSSFKSASITNMCQSVVTPNIPLLGSVSLVLKAAWQRYAGRGVEPVHRRRGPQRRRCVPQHRHRCGGFYNTGADKGGKGPGMKGGSEAANPYGFAQQAESAELTNVKQTAWATTAGTFKLSGLKMSVSAGTHECY